MRIAIFLSLLATLTLAVLGSSPTLSMSSDTPQPLEENLASTLVDSSADLSPLQFEDGTVSLNDRCPVRKVKLNTRLRPMFVNGQPIGFC